jgi:small subunit ribosomal protein S20
MAHHKSAKKRIRRNHRREEINGARIGRIRTFVKKVETAIANGDQAAANVALREAQPELQRGVSKGVLHKNTAARKISRLNQRIKALG